MLLVQIPTRRMVHLHGSRVDSRRQAHLLPLPSPPSLGASHWKGHRHINGVTAVLISPMRFLRRRRRLASGRDPHHRPISRFLGDRVVVRQQTRHISPRRFLNPRTTILARTKRVQRSWACQFLARRRRQGRRSHKTMFQIRHSPQLLLDAS